MHFVTGGAFNGKRAWVKEKYPEGKWASAYLDEPLVEDLSTLEANVVVLEGLEKWIKAIIEEKGMEQSRGFWRNVLDRWFEWEMLDSGRQVILIGADITKGIVPIEKEGRAWRDLTGWAFQDVAAKCTQVDVIWYGINQTIKKSL